MLDILYILLVITIGLIVSTLIFGIFIYLKHAIGNYFFGRWVYFETGIYQNIETGDVIIVQNDQMKLVEHGLHKGQYVKIDNDYGVYFYDKINEE